MRNKDIIAQHIEGKVTEWGDARTAKEESWRRYYRTWRLIEDDTDKKKKHERSKIKIPATKQAINTAVDNLYMMIIGSGTFFDIEGRQIEDMPKAAVLKSYIDYLFHVEQMPNKIHSFLANMCIYGTAIAEVKNSVKFDKKLVQMPKMLFGFPISMETIVEEKRINRPEFECVDIFNFFIEPGARSIEESEGIITKTVGVKLKELYRMQKNGEIDSVDLLKDSGSSEIDEETQYKAGKTGVTITEGSGYDVYKYWGWLDEEVLKDAGYKNISVENGGAEVLALCANGVILKCVENPLYAKERPFITDCFEEVPNEFYGMGICEVAEGAQSGLDATVRQRIDNKSLAINQIFEIDMNKFVEGQDLELYPGKKFLSRGGGAITPFVIPDVTQGTFQEAFEFERYIQEAAGISKIASGIAATKEQTATESSILINQASVRLRAIAKSVEDNVIKNILRLYYQNIIQFLEIPEIIKVADMNGANLLLSIDPRQLVGDYDFIPLGTPTLASKNNVAKLIDFLSRTANPFDIQIVNRPYLIKKIYEGMGFTDTTLAINNIPTGQMIENSQMLQNTGSAPVIQGEQPPMNLSPQGMGTGIS